MRGHQRLNWAAFEEKASYFRSLGNEVFCPTEAFSALGVDPENPPEMSKQFIADCLSAAIKEMGSCDTIYMLAGWRKSSGARCEHAAAVALGLLVQEEKAIAG